MFRVFFCYIDNRLSLLSISQIVIETFLSLKSSLVRENIISICSSVSFKLTSKPFFCALVDCQQFSNLYLSLENVNYLSRVYLLCGADLGAVIHSQAGERKFAFNLTKWKFWKIFAKTNVFEQSSKFNFTLNLNIHLNRFQNYRPFFKCNFNFCFMSRHLT